MVAAEAAGCLLTYEVFEAAAIAGQLSSCQWLFESACPTCPDGSGGRSGLLAAAASGGHQHVCEWLLTLALTWSTCGDAEAAGGGHVGLMEWLRERRSQLRVLNFLPDEEQRLRLLEGSARGCDLPTLQRLWQQQCGNQLGRNEKARVLAAATGADGVSTPSEPDWALKVEWLWSQGCRPTRLVVEAAASCSDASRRLAWLRGRGFSVGEAAVTAAARTGNLEALTYLLAEAVVHPCSDGFAAGRAAAGVGQLLALQALYGAGWPLDDPYIGHAAARGGHLHVLVWLGETLGAGAVPRSTFLFAVATTSGSVELLAWLRQRGCPWDHAAYKGAAESGCVMALEWLAEHGCPMPGNGAPYVAACLNGDLASARCLRRLGCPWGPSGEVFYRVATWGPLPMVRWLLEAGCPFDYEAELARAALAARAGPQRIADVLKLLCEHGGRGAAGASAAAAATS
ncbi:hypothetical protein GPECTOR_25g451 [Gonium pectorale]|uniref:Ankyrin repeat domain-containing protein n=1 Tax=Gonium pectorale TaxID=33097 RepID=A0A150GGB3_GONPE|nr:hypothetical protein GPECTOR_25g451 [Gonium pectorale]|eukprot:KXZ48866.1 hypothetical protein GPECTOR_25g451 [Gonium pectorale]